MLHTSTARELLPPVVTCSLNYGCFSETESFTTWRSGTDTATVQFTNTQLCVRQSSSLLEESFTNKLMQEFLVLFNRQTNLPGPLILLCICVKGLVMHDCQFYTERVFLVIVAVVAYSQPPCLRTAQELSGTANTESLAYTREDDNAVMPHLELCA